MKLFDKVKLGNITLENRVVMAPMTRSRAIANLPNEIMVTYYQQRASAGLIITEGVSPSPNGLGYARIPGVFSEEQVKAWNNVSSAVHHAGGKIFMQLMHTGRSSHPDNLPANAKVLAPSPIAMTGEIYTDQAGMQAYPIPIEMTIADIEATIQEYVQAAIIAIDAGFDGVELHGANGYLIDQFINPASNQRNDVYGGSMQNRSKFVLEVASRVASAIGQDKTGIRLSPFGVFNDMLVFEGIETTFEYLANELGKLELCYLHIVDHSSMGAPLVPKEIKTKMKKAFGGTFIGSGGFDAKEAEKALEANEADLIAFGRPFIANPDLVSRMKKEQDLATPDYSTFYTPGEKGYTDYPVFQG